MPDEAYTIPFGEANIVRDGDDVTVVALARMVHYAGDAAETLAAEGIECEIIDPRTTSPLDEDTILESVERTGRLVVVDEATPRCSMATDIAALVADKAFGCAEGADPPGDGAAHAGAVRAVAGEALHPGPGTDRRRGARGSRVSAMTRCVHTSIRRMPQQKPLPRSGRGRRAIARRVRVPRSTPVLHRAMPKACVPPQFPHPPLRGFLSHSVGEVVYRRPSE